MQHDIYLQCFSSFSSHSQYMIPTSSTILNENIHSKVSTVPFCFREKAFVIELRYGCCPDRLETADLSDTILPVAELLWAPSSFLQCGLSCDRTLQIWKEELQLFSSLDTQKNAKKQQKSFYKNKISLYLFFAQVPLTRTEKKDHLTKPHGPWTSTSLH